MFLPNVFLEEIYFAQKTVFTGNVFLQRTTWYVYVIQATCSGVVGWIMQMKYLSQYPMFYSLTVFTYLSFISCVRSCY